MTRDLISLCLILYFCNTSVVTLLRFLLKENVAHIKEMVMRILQGQDTSVLERSVAPRSLSPDYNGPDKYTAVRTIKSRFQKSDTFLAD